MPDRSAMRPANFICLKWGTKYPAAYVNRLYRMVERNFPGPFRLHCLTDDDTGLDRNIVALPLAPEELVGYWNKLALFKRELHGLSGNLIYLDLDLVIVGDIGFLAEQPGEFIIVRNWSRRPMWNSSVMRFPVGAYAHIWDEFSRNRTQILDAMNGDQEWIFECVPNAATWPAERILSYKKSLASKAFPALHKLGLGRLGLRAPAWMDTPLPDQAAIVLFHGKPDPEDVAGAPFGPWKRASFVARCWR
ncbi:hypothetical protein [Thiosocius teredinicola]|uniref:hypothetical protein n=1 Tax=Thiosocius teredinicola TaxID=1973002 RepID=UPI000F78941D